MDYSTKRFVNRHLAEQVPRLKELKRYYLADNNIKYRPPKLMNTLPTIE